MKRGYSANPNGKAHMRRLNAVLNGNYQREGVAVEELDWLRKQKDESGMKLTDRVILRELLIHNHQNRMGYEIPPSESAGGYMSVQLLQQFRTLIEESVHNVLSHLNLQIGSQETLRQEVTESVNHVISTANLMSRSYVFEGDVPEEDLPE